MRYGAHDNTKLEVSVISRLFSSAEASPSRQLFGPTLVADCWFSWWAGARGVCCQTFSFVLVSLFSMIGNPTGVFREASRGSAALIGITRVGVAVNGVIQEKVA